MLQRHNVLFPRLPPDSLLAAKVNVFWDGVFHAGARMLTVIGLALLWRAGSRRDVLCSRRAFAGALMAGFGLFNVIDGTIDHQIPGLHHVHGYSGARLNWDVGFLLLGAALIAGARLPLTRGGGNEARAAE